MTKKPADLKKASTEPTAAGGDRREPFRAFLESVDQGFCILEVLGEPGQRLDYRFVDANSAFETQTGLADVVGKHMRELRPEHEESWFQRFGEVARSGRSLRFEHVAKALGRYYDVFAFPVGESEQRLVGALFRDISAEVQTRQTLAESHRKKDEFIATLSHELRNPLFAVRNGVELLWRACGNQPEARSTIEMLERQVGQITRLMDDLLDVSRLSRGKIELDRKAIELSSVAQGVIETFQPIAADDQHVLTVTVPPEPIYLKADPTRLAQVMGNLLNNAIKFTGSGGLVRLIIAREGNEAVIRVQDSGIGMAADQLPGIFDMFSQVDTSLERMQSGLGIGLTMAKNLVEMHGGRVEAHSAGLGQGSEFIVRLPIDTDRSPEPAPASSANALRDLPRRRILVVDDNRDAAQSLSLLLELSGHEVHTAYDGLEAVEAVDRLQPDTVFLDIGMPRMNGYDAARTIRKHHGDAAPLLIALTGYGQDQDRERAVEAGFDTHLVKPADFLSLSRALAASPARPAAGQD